MKLTWDNIHAAGTRGCGFTRAQLAVVGIRWPPPKGWLRKLIGKEITSEQYEAFKDARNTYVNRKGKVRRRNKPLSAAPVPATHSNDKAREIARIARREKELAQMRERLRQPESAVQPCARCAKYERYLDLDICEECVSQISGYRDEQN
jgi:hypothetical protein